MTCSQTDTQNNLLTAAEEDWFAGGAQTELLQRYEESEIFFTLEKIRRLFKKNVAANELSEWEEELKLFQEAYLRYHYFLRLWYSVEEGASLRMSLTPRYKKVQNLYVDAKYVFVAFVNQRYLKEGADAKAISDWFAELRHGLERLCPANQGK